MDSVTNFINGVKGFIDNTVDLLIDVVDVLHSLYDLSLSFIDFFPSPFKEMTLFTIGIIFALVLWRLKR